MCMGECLSLWVSVDVYGYVSLCMGVSIAIAIARGWGNSHDSCHAQ